jgi:hypothetical protein
VGDGRYLAREGGEEDGAQSVLVVETLRVTPSPSRRRRRAREAGWENEPSPAPLSRVTAIRAFEPLGSDEEAALWLDGAVASEEAVDAIVEEGIGLLNRALHAHAAASGDPHVHELSPGRATTVRIGYGSGEEVAVGRFAAAREIDFRGGAGSTRMRRDAELRPQERVAAVLGGREHVDACETLLLRARADLDAGRTREAALQLRVGLEALLIELRGALTDPDHEEDMATLEARRTEAGEAANMALKGDLDDERARNVEELLYLCERILRRRRVLRG